MILSDMFSEVRKELHDTEANVYTNELLLTFYNLLQRELNRFLVRLGAEDAMKSGTITGDGSAQSYALETDFLAMVMEGLHPRSPITNGTGYYWAPALPQVDRNHPSIYQEATGIAAGTPSCWTLSRSGAVYSVKFDITPISGYTYDYEYWPKLTAVNEGEVGSQNTPWNGALDTVIQPALTVRAKAGMEFSVAKQESWLAAAFADAYLIMGQRKLRDQTATSNMWAGVDGC